MQTACLRNSLVILKCAILLNEYFDFFYIVKVYYVIIFVCNIQKLTKNYQQDVKKQCCDVTTSVCCCRDIYWRQHSMLTS